MTDKQKPTAESPEPAGAASGSGTGSPRSAAEAPKPGGGSQPAKPSKLAETQDGTVLYNLDPIILKDHWEVDYIHSYAQDSPFFAGLSQKKLLGSRCPACGYVYATPRGHCAQCGVATEWHELPQEGTVHTFTTCYFGGEAFLAETPFTLVLVEFEGADTLFLSRLVGVEDREVSIGMPVRARFLRNSKFKPTDVYFIRADPAS